jgi:hypothetical protein
MNKILIILLMALPISFSAFATDQPQKPSTKKTLLIEGFKFDRMDGLVTKDEKSNKWFFTPDKDLTDGIGSLPAGEKIQLLPSSTLESIISLAQNSSQTIRLSATVTKYRGQNFFFPTYFMPMDQSKEAPPETQTQENIEKDEPKTESIIPEDIMKKLKPTRRPDFTRRKQIAPTDQDSILAGRTGFVKIGQEKTTFGIDSLGRNVEKTYFQLLPCQLLERLENKLAKSPHRQRFRVIGIITKYKNTYYLLPQQATRTYDHGNFAR